MPKPGNSIQVVSSLTAVINWTTVSWLLVMIPNRTGLLKTHGVLHGETADISPLKQVTLADVLMLLHIPMHEKIENNKNYLKRVLLDSL
jgi:hypothetical protein